MKTVTPGASPSSMATGGEDPLLEAAGTIPVRLSRLIVVYIIYYSLDLLDQPVQFPASHLIVQCLSSPVKPR